MNDKIVTLKQERARAITELRQMVEDAEKADRSLNAEEREKYDHITETVNTLAARIRDIETVKEQTRSIDDFNAILEGGQLGRSKEERNLEGEVREYNSAFDTYLRYGIEGMDMEQRMTLSKGRAEVRADMVKGTTTAGGFTVPQSFSDRLFALQIQQGGVRQTRVQVFKTGDGRDMPVPYASAHASAEWGTENTAATKVAETFAQVTLKAYQSQILSLVSMPLLQDSAFDLQTFLMNYYAQKIGRLQNAGFVSGGGSTQPTGANTCTVGKTTASATAIVDTEVFALYHSIIPPYRMVGEFLLSDSAIQQVATFKSTTGQYLWNLSLRDGEPDRLLGRPVYNDPDLATVATGNVVGLFADWNNGYAIRDVNEFNILRLNERYADQFAVGFIGWQRTDGNLIDTAAIRSLKMA